MNCPKCGKKLHKSACNCGFDLNNQPVLFVGEAKKELEEVKRSALHLKNIEDVPVAETPKPLWNYKEPFVYDGKLKTVALSTEKKNLGFWDRLFGKKAELCLTGVPEGYDVIYGNNSATDAGVYQATARLVSKSDNQKGTIEIEPLTWEIKKAIPDLSNAKWDYSHPFIYDGSERRVELSGLPDCVTASYYNNAAVESGSYKAAVVLRTKDSRNYEAPGIVSNCNWQIEKASYDLTQVRWTYDDDSFYDGKEKTVRLIGLPEGVRIEAYKGNKAIDVGSYTAEAIVNYENQDNYIEPYISPLHWRIRKKQYNMSDVRWVYNDDFTYDGKEKTVRVTGLPKGVKVEAYRGNKAIDAGGYVAEVILKYDKEFYEEPAIPPLKWEIHKGEIDTSGISWNYDEPFVYDGEEKTVELVGLPDTVEVTYYDNTGINAGDHEAIALIEAKDPHNYETPRPVEGCLWHIGKASYDMSRVYWTYEQAFTYDGNEKQVILEGLPDSIAVRYRDNRAAAIGTYTAKAYLTYDSDNYNIIDFDSTIDWSIIPQDK